MRGRKRTQKGEEERGLPSDSVGQHAPQHVPDGLAHEEDGGDDGGVGRDGAFIELRVRCTTRGDVILVGAEDEGHVGHEHRRERRPDHGEDDAGDDGSGVLRLFRGFSVGKSGLLHWVELALAREKKEAYKSTTPKRGVE